jgi:heme oxygenase
VSQATTISEFVTHQLFFYLDIESAVKKFPSPQIIKKQTFDVMNFIREQTFYKDYVKLSPTIYRLNRRE